MVNDTRFRNRVVRQILIEAFPVERGFLAPPIDPLKDQSLGHVVVSLKSAAITADTIVLISTRE